MRIERVKGSVDRLPGDSAERRRIVTTLQAWFEQHGFHGVDLPVVEPADLFLRKAGGELLTKLYSFVEPGGRRVALRPEFTASVVRAYLEHSAPEPVNWHYAGPVFRFNPLSELRELYQQGVESIGSQGWEVDADLVVLANEGLRLVGVAGSSAVLGHVGVLNEAIGGFGLSERTTTTLLAGIATLVKSSDGPEMLLGRLFELGLVSDASSAAILRDALLDLGGDTAQVVIRGILEGVNVDLLGAREPDEIVARLFRKLAGWDDPKQIQRAIEFAGLFARLRGAPGDTIAAAKTLLSEWKLSAPSLDEFALEASAIEKGLASSDAELRADGVVVDFGLVREFGYYSGLVFEIQHSGLGVGEALCGGGRYDGLVRAFGGVDIPAAGFAYGIDWVARALGSTVNQATSFE